MLKSKLYKIVIPGDEIGKLEANEEGYRLGAGLMQDKDKIIATKPGMLFYKSPNTFWVETISKRVPFPFFYSLLPLYSSPSPTFPFSPFILTHFSNEKKWVVHTKQGGYGDWNYNGKDERRVSGGVGKCSERYFGLSQV